MHCVEKEKEDAFSRIIQAGGGTVLDVKPPYFYNQLAMNATHCFVDKSRPIDDMDRRALKLAGVHIMKINFLNAYLAEGEVDNEKYVI